MTDLSETTIIKNTYMLSNLHAWRRGIERRANSHSADVDAAIRWHRSDIKQEIYHTNPIWILFAAIKSPVVINHPRHGRGIAYDDRIEIHKYIDSEAAKSKIVDAEEARAEWRFWIDQGFRRITNVNDKGWEYTKKIMESSDVALTRQSGGTFMQVKQVV